MSTITTVLEPGLNGQRRKIAYRIEGRIVHCMNDPRGQVFRCLRRNIGMIRAIFMVISWWERGSLFVDR